MDKTRRKSKLKPIARRRHNYVYLLLAILLGISTIYLFLTYPPDYRFHISSITIPVLPIFILSLIACVFSALTFIFIQKIQGLIVSALLLVFLIMRLLGLTHWIFAFLLIALFITIEVIIYKQK